MEQCRAHEGTQLAPFCPGRYIKEKEINELARRGAELLAFFLIEEALEICKNKITASLWVQIPDHAGTSA